MTEINQFIQFVVPIHEANNMIAAINIARKADETSPEQVDALTLLRLNLLYQMDNQPEAAPVVKPEAEKATGDDQETKSIVRRKPVPMKRSPRK